MIRLLTAAVQCVSTYRNVLLATYLTTLLAIASHRLAVHKISAGTALSALLQITASVQNVLSLRCACQAMRLTMLPATVSHPRFVQQICVGTALHVIRLTTASVHSVSTHASVRLTTSLTLTLAIANRL